jgi:uncharacterized membrane protein YkvA (DUF1232 family)
LQPRRITPTFTGEMSTTQDIALTAPDAAAEAAASEQRDEAIVREGFWRKIGRVAGRVPFAEDAVAAYFCAFDADTPFRVRATLVGALAYFILPADVLPDFLPVLGFADDASVIAAALTAVGANMTDKHRQSARRALGRLPKAEASPDGQTATS